MAKVVAKSQPVSKAQQMFQRLIAKIETRRRQLQQWQDFQPKYLQRVAAEVEPLEAKLDVGRRRMAELIDELLSKPAPGRKLTRLQRAKLEQLLMELVEGLLGDDDDEALEALHDKYSDVSREQVRQWEMEMTEGLMSDLLGVEIGSDHGASTPEELVEHAQRILRERAEREAHEGPAQHHDHDAGRTRARGAKAEAARARKEQAAKEVSQTLREVYRKLASALHPDRELDEAARQRKTLLMQRVNDAYAANDLLTLLTLQLEIEQIDAAHLSSMPAQRLTHYNQILREQLDGLEAELEGWMLPFRQMPGLGRDPMPDAVDRQLSIELAHMRTQLRQLEADMVAFRDPVALRDMLKGYALEQDLPDPDDFTDLLDAMAIAPPMPGSRKRRKG